MLKTSWAPGLTVSLLLPLLLRVDCALLLCGYSPLLLMVATVGTQQS